MTRCMAKRYGIVYFYVQKENTEYSEDMIMKFLAEWAVSL